MRRQTKALNNLTFTIITILQTDFSFLYDFSLWQQEITNNSNQNQFLSHKAQTDTVFSVLIKQKKWDIFTCLSSLAAFYWLRKLERSLPHQSTSDAAAQTTRRVSEASWRHESQVKKMGTEVEKILTKPLQPCHCFYDSHVFIEMLINHQNSRNRLYAELSNLVFRTASVFSAKLNAVITFHSESL